jgi:hypothetical protein
MTFAEYLRFAATKLEEENAKNDKDEYCRLVNCIVQACIEQLSKMKAL